MILHRGVRYLEMGALIDLRAQQQRTQKMIVHYVVSVTASNEQPAQRDFRP